MLDLAIFFDLPQRAKLSGIYEWLSFYFKSPQVAPGLYLDATTLFIQQTKMKNTLRWLMGEAAITHQCRALRVRRKSENCVSGKW
ncbi:MAG: inositol-3-phosphate synthase [Gemmatimonadales bacterium]